MKKCFVVKLAAVALLALGSFSHAQDDTPTPDAVAAVVDAQESVSDQPAAEGEVIAPVSQVVDGMPLNQGLVISPSDCVGCGQVLPVMGSAVATGCYSGCNTCGTQTSFVQPSFVQPATYAAPMQGCGTCGTVAQVAYQTPATQQSFGSVISAAPIVTSGVPATTVSSPSTFVTPTVATPVTGTIYAQPAITSQPVFNQPLVTQPTTAGCAGCAAAATNPAPIATGYVTPTTTGFASPAITSFATPTTTYPAPVATSYVAPTTTTGCVGCGTTGTTFAAPAVGTTTTCNGCPQPRRLLGGRLLRNRR